MTSSCQNDSTCFHKRLLRNLQRAQFPVALESTTSLPSQFAEVICGEFRNQRGMEVSACLVRPCNHEKSTKTAIICSTSPFTTMRKTHGSVLQCSIPYSATASTDNPTHCRPLCFRSYSDRFRRTIFPGVSPHSPGGFMYISASSFARTRACGNYKWKNFKRCSSATAARISTDAYDGVGANVWK